MHQQNPLFSDNAALDLAIPNAQVRLYRSWLEEGEASLLLNKFVEELPWEQAEIIIAGQRRLIPRLQAWCGDPGANLRYSGREFKANRWHPLLEDLRTRLQTLSGFRFNSVLANLYRNGEDSVGWHADDERELGQAPKIASLSLGAERLFKFKYRGKAKNGGAKIIKVNLQNGDLLSMAGSTQKHWLHSVPKCANSTGLRVNLTFRLIVELS